MTTDSPDVVIAKRLLDYAKLSGFQFRRVAPGEDAPLVGHRIGDDCVDLIHLEGFSHDCFAWPKRDIIPGRSREGTGGTPSGGQRAPGTERGTYLGFG